MSETTGESKSNLPVYSVDEELKHIEKILGDCEVKLSFPANEKIRLDIEEILCFDFKAKLSSVEYCEMSIKLSRYAIFLQGAINRVEAKVFWIKEEIKRIVLPRLNQQNAFKDDLKLDMAIAENSVATRWNKIRIHYEMILKNFSYRASKIQHLSDRFMDLAKKSDIKVQ
jgi:hypothetical protein